MSDTEKFEHAGLTVRIVQDDCPESPRDWDNLGTMQSVERDYGPNERFKGHYTFWDVIESLADYAANFKIRAYDVPREHLLRAVNKHYVILPYWRSRSGECSVGTYPIAESDERCDGLIFLSFSRLQSEGLTPERAAECLKGEVETYGQWASGDVFGYVIEDENGETLDSCWGFYGLEYAIGEAKTAAEYVASQPNYAI